MRVRLDALAPQPRSERKRPARFSRGPGEGAERAAGVEGELAIPMPWGRMFDRQTVVRADRLAFGVPGAGCRPAAR
jgi:hypothetical protein